MTVLRKTCCRIGMVLVLTLLFAGGLPTGAPSFAGHLSLLRLQAPPTCDSAVYTDGLTSTWQNWSWESTVNLANSAPVASGSTSVAVTYNKAWAGFFLHTDTILTGSHYRAVRFHIHGGTAGQQALNLVMMDKDNKPSGPGIPVRPVAGAWSIVEVPLATLGSPATISGLILQDTSGGTQPTFFLDEIMLTCDTTPLSVHVDAEADVHAISPYIYGMNFADEALAAELRLPVRRWGGNSTSRYNWQLDTHNTGSDWYFENVPDANPAPEQLPTRSTVDRFVEQDRRTATKTLLTIPLIGWTPKARPTGHPYDCGYSVVKYGPQQSVDPYDTNCGNGNRVDGTPITNNDPLDTSKPIDPSFAQAWLQHLIGRFSTAANGGVAFYNLDNEPGLWNSTHRDVHPNHVLYDELRARTIQYAAALKAIDPGALTLGPVQDGWTRYFYASYNTHPDTVAQQDRTNHGGLPFVVWYLQQMRAYEQQNHLRLVDYFDLHYYPQANRIALLPAGDANTQALRLRSTRSLWDATYVDESWIPSTGDATPVNGMGANGAVQLIPRMRAWVNDNYPGTKLAISEYNWGAFDHINGALAQADVLGIFGRAGLDLATLWQPQDPNQPPVANQPGAFAFRMYRNYDGVGNAFGETSVKATSADQDRLASYAARRSSDGALTLMIVNKTTTDLTSRVELSNFIPRAHAQVFRYSAASVNGIVREPDQPVAASGFSTIFPAESITLFVVDDQVRPAPYYLPIVGR